MRQNDNGGVLKLLALIFGGLIAVYLAIKLLGFVTALLFKIAIPVLVIGGVVYVGYKMFGPKSLGGGRRRLP